MGAHLSNYDNENSKWVHTETDISGEAANVQAICNAVWTTYIKNIWKRKLIEQ